LPDLDAAAPRCPSAKLEGCAYRICYLLTHADFATRLGQNGHEHVKENFVITTNLQRWLLLFRILNGV
jgi:hypothetical protein